MPVNFLSPVQARRYGRYNGDPAPTQLAKYFFLDDKDRAEIACHRGSHNRLGYATQLCTVRFLGTFLPDPTDVPRVVVKHLAAQLGMRGPDCLEQYRDRPATHLAHVAEIRQRHGYCDFGDQPEHWCLVRRLYTRAWLSQEASGRLIRPGHCADGGTKDSAAGGDHVVAAHIHDPRACLSPALENLGRLGASWAAQAPALFAAPSQTGREFPFRSDA